MGAVLTVHYEGICNTLQALFQAPYSLVGRMHQPHLWNSPSASTPIWFWPRQGRGGDQIRSRITRSKLTPDVGMFWPETPSLTNIPPSCGVEAATASLRESRTSNHCQCVRTSDDTKRLATPTGTNPDKGRQEHFEILGERNRSDITLNSYNVAA